MSTKNTTSSTPIHEFFSTEENINKLKWEEVFALENLNPEYVPQGIAVHDDLVYHTIHKKDTKSILIIFRKSDPTLLVVKELELPPEATHTSDLTVYKGHFYAIDYHSNYIYQLDFKELRHKLKLKVIRKVRVTKPDRQFGSFEIVEHEGKEYLFVTTFLKDNRMYVFDFDAFFRQRLGFEKSLLFSIESSFFTQGLCLSSTAKSLFHSVNRFGVDFIFELDIRRLLLTKNYRESITRSFLGPDKMIEDLAVQGDTVYTSDEYVNKVYRANLTEAVIATDFVFNDLSGVPHYGKLLSHRARVWDFQENTLDAFVEVLSTNVKYIEIDIRFSSDDVAYVYHDSFFKEGKKKFRFSEKTWAEVEEQRYEHKELRISKLEEVLQHFATHKKEGQILALDLKDFGYERYIFDLCKNMGLIDSIIIFTWTPQVIFAFDMIFQEEGVAFPLYFSHVRVDSMFKYLLIPTLLNHRKFFFAFKDFVLISNANYNQPLGKYEKGYRHVPYFAQLPEDLKAILKKYSGGICVTKKRGRWGDDLLRQYKNGGLKVAIFGAFFGLVKINTKEEFEYEAQKSHIDIVFMDDLSRIPSSPIK